MAKNIKKLQVVLEEGKVIFDEGEQTKEMYILLKGEVEILKGVKSIAKINASGSFIGEMATLLDAPRTAKVVTTQKSVMLKVEPDDVDVLFKVTPELGYSLSKSLAERLAIMTEKVMEANALSGASQNTQEENKISKEEISAAEKEMEKEQAAPESLEDKINFLSRTEVHKDVMRYYFNHIGQEVEITDLIQTLECPDILVKLILAEFRGAELVKVGEGRVSFLFSEQSLPIVEQWVFSNGLFRSAS